ncbi:MAG: hypothetical protein WC145_10220 [Aliarcobacter sp.]|jgi:hypothetical protein
MRPEAKYVTLPDYPEDEFGYGITFGAPEDATVENTFFVPEKNPALIAMLNALLVSPHEVWADAPTDDTCCEFALCPMGWPVEPWEYAMYVRVVVQPSGLEDEADRAYKVIWWAVEEAKEHDYKKNAAEWLEVNRKGKAQ